MRARQAKEVPLANVLSSLNPINQQKPLQIPPNDKYVPAAITTAYPINVD